MIKKNNNIKTYKHVILKSGLKSALYGGLFMSAIVLLFGFLTSGLVKNSYPAIVTLGFGVILFITLYILITFVMCIPAYFIYSFAKTRVADRHKKLVYPLIAAGASFLIFDGIVVVKKIVEYIDLGFLRYSLRESLSISHSFFVAGLPGMILFGCLVRHYEHRYASSLQTTAVLTD
jgi:hypothetical protein